MLNHIVIMGRITHELELKTTNSGVEFVTFSVAVDRDFQPKDGEKQTDFFSVTAWRHTAKFITSYFGKGRMIVIDGSMQSRKYTDDAGNNRVSWAIQADNVYFGDSKRSDSETSVPSSTSAPSDFATIEGDDEGLPF